MGKWYPRSKHVERTLKVHSIFKQIVKSVDVYPVQIPFRTTQIHIGYFHGRVWARYSESSENMTDFFIQNVFIPIFLLNASFFMGVPGTFDSKPTFSIAL